MSSKISSLMVLAAASIALTFGVAGCSKTDIQNNGAQNQPSQTDQSQNPADTANLAPTDGTQAAGTNPQQPAGQAVQQTDQQAAPAVQQASQEQNYSAGYQNTSYGQPVLQARRPPPPLPQYSQPLCPGNGYLWTPGYWSYSPQGYYWVPGAWVWPPQVGFLWTPGYWGFFGGMYQYNYGFWGQHVGYYGGIDYGFGYFGTGYQGGYWSGDSFNYNRAVNNVNITNVSVYNRTIDNTTTNPASYNGPGGVTRQALPAETAALREQRIPPMTTQVQHQQAAAQNRQQFASVNQGRPAVFATTKPIPAGKPIAPVIPARTATQQHGQQQQRAQSQPQQHGQQQQRAQSQPPQHAQQQRAQQQPQQHAQQQPGPGNPKK
jgi:hypothetical protein